MSNLKKRGRPPNTGKNEDLPLMPKIADFMVRDKLNVSDAIRKVEAKAIADVSLLTRLQRKFRDNRDQYLADAQVRLEEERTRRAERAIRSYSGGGNLTAASIAAGNLGRMPWDHLAAGSSIMKMLDDMPGERLRKFIESQERLTRFAAGADFSTRAGQIAMGLDPLSKIMRGY